MNIASMGRGLGRAGMIVSLAAMAVVGLTLSQQARAADAPQDIVDPAVAAGSF